MSTAAGVSFDRLCVIAGLPRPVPEYPFAIAIGRKWRFDWAWPSEKIALEIDGGGYVRGRHHRPAGFANDCVKFAHAIVLDWKVFRFTPRQIRDGTAISFLSRILRGH